MAICIAIDSVYGWRWPAGTTKPPRVRGLGQVEVGAELEEFLEEPVRAREVDHALVQQHGKHHHHRAAAYEQRDIGRKKAAGTPPIRAEAAPQHDRQCQEQR